VVAAIFEASVDRDQAERLADLMRKGRDTRAEGVRIASLLYENGVAQVIAIWESKDTLDRYVSAVPVPKGVELFRTIGVEPRFRVVEVLESS
jgi:hypothetical protein